MSTERRIPTVWPQLDGLGALAREATLEYCLPSRQEVQSLVAGDLLRADPADLVGLHLFLRVPAEARTKLEDAVRASGLRLGDVQAVLVAEDGFLKERNRIAHWPAADWAGNARVAVRTPGGKDLPRALKNPHGGFSLTFAFVLREGVAVDPRKPAPHMKGTILGDAATWEVRSTRTGPALDPRPLTPEVRERAGLHKDTLLFVECDGDLLDCDSLDIIEVFIHEGLCALLEKRKRSLERKMILTMLSQQALAHVALRLSAECSEREKDWVWDGESGAAMRLVYGAYRGRLSSKEARQMTPRAFTGLLRDCPDRVAAMLTAASGAAAMGIRLLGEDDPAVGVGRRQDATEGERS